MHTFFSLRWIYCFVETFVFIIFFRVHNRYTSIDEAEIPVYTCTFFNKFKDLRI